MNGERELGDFLDVRIFRNAVGDDVPVNGAARQLHPTGASVDLVGRFVGQAQALPVNVREANRRNAPWHVGGASKGGGGVTDSDFIGLAVGLNLNCARLEVSTPNQVQLRRSCNAEAQ